MGARGFVNLCQYNRVGTRPAPTDERDNRDPTIFIPDSFHTYRHNQARGRHTNRN